MKCLIIAAGKGSRLQQTGNCKPLVPILGVPLIERVIRAAMEAGASEFYVVIGYHGEQVNDFLDHLAHLLGVSITSLVNDDWEKENGLSVLKAEDVLHEPFLLLMADHLFDPNLLRPLLSLSLGKDEIVLGLDYNINNSLIDIEDVTRVKVEDDDGSMECLKIRDIGKGLADFNGFDTGIFLCSPIVFKALGVCRT